MKKVIFTLICLFAMLATGKGLRAQEITITLQPGWTWISYPNAEEMDIASALGDFVPMDGDMIKSMYGTSRYSRNRWSGSVTHFIPGWGFMYYSSRTENVDFVFAQAASSNVTTAEPTNITNTSAVVGGTVTVPEGGHVFLRGVCWGTEPDPDIDGNHTSEETGVGAFSSTIEGLTTGLTYYVRAYAVTDNGLVYGDNQSFVASYDYVDLGLPSGLLWATCNVGADNPEDYGDYFAWGETEPKVIYAGSNIAYRDNPAILPSDHDAATVNWGNGWRMPTKEEFEELYNNTYVIWTQQGGVDGNLFTASNGNSLFLPAAGYRWDGEFIDDKRGDLGFYWSSSIDWSSIDWPSSIEDELNAPWYFFFGSGFYCMDSDSRSRGMPVRPVRSGLQNFIIDATANPSEGGEVSGGGSYQEGAECTLTAMANTGYTFTNWTENDEIVSTDATYTFTVNTGRTLVANFIYHAYVDLGLPSGALWATCNVGADNPEDYGNYFAWGETETKDTYKWSTYQYCMGSARTLTKYCSDSSYGYNGFTDDLTTLLPEDDAATANWGNGWRMPTNEEFQELLDNTTVTWTTQNGVDGCLFTASNGNSLFLPAAGYRSSNSIYETGSDGRYWSSSLYTDDPSCAWYHHFKSGLYNMNNYRRSYGRSVRPVCSGQIVVIATCSPVVGGEVSGGGTYPEGAACMLTATPSEGWSFVNWTENGEVVSTEAEYSFTVNNHRHLVANFTRPKTITASVNIEGSGTIAGAGEYDYGTECTLIAVSNEGYSFVNWTDHGAVVSTNASYSFIVKGDRELVANFALPFTIMVSINPEEGGTVTGAGEYDYRTECTLTAVSNEGYTFVNWTDHGAVVSTNVSYSFIVTGDRELVANFALPFTIMVSINPEEGGTATGAGDYDYGTECTLTAVPNEGYTFVNWTENGIEVSSEASYSFTVTGDRNLEANFANFVDPNIHNYVDLGLPSGLLWATCNVGACAPEAYGDHFAWGETQPKSTYNWYTYQYCDAYDIEGFDDVVFLFTKYVYDDYLNWNDDGLTTLLPEDDAATANWGEGWRMPTREDWNELLNNTTSTWTTQNGVNGRLFTALNGNSLFLPAAGNRWDDEHNNPGLNGYYWSSSLDTDQSPYDAWHFCFSSDNAYTDKYFRSLGYSVRPVREN